MTNNVTDFPTTPAKRSYTLTYIENPLAPEPALTTSTAVGFLVELGPFTGISENTGERISAEALVMIPTMNLTCIQSEAVTVN